MYNITLIIQHFFTPFKIKQNKFFFNKNILLTSNNINVTDVIVYFYTNN